MIHWFLKLYFKKIFQLEICQVRMLSLPDAAQVPLDDRDVYLIEAETFINAIKTGDADKIESLYEDSALSYQATQWITDASSENRHEKSDPKTWPTEVLCFT